MLWFRALMSDAPSPTVSELAVVFGERFNVHARMLSEEKGEVCGNEFLCDPEGDEKTITKLNYIATLVPKTRVVLFSYFASAVNFGFHFA